ncbi:tetratricopeptide repeat protein [Acrocarpospora sp. B8E8]|uniref:ATP-binding protein n=1 Tax=Acrocarpospora sp. B8E8 TaxID=3153572 RepID=UPI00325FD29D
MTESGQDNVFSGTVTNVVQAGTIFGGIHSTHAKLPPPRQLPRVATHFTARTEAMSKLSEISATENGVAVISGTAGVGKSALAVFWAHTVENRFPDGQLYIDLRGYDRLAPLQPKEVLHGFLRSLNVPTDQVFADLDAMSAIFRSLIYNKAMLIVADNAVSAEQVRPLLPSSPTCFTIVTSRNQLGSLTAVDGATSIPIKPLRTKEAVQLFKHISGHDDNEATTELVTHCGRLPLTVRIAAQQASAMPDLEELVEEFRADHDRLAAFATLDEGTEIRTVFSWSYQELRPPIARAFRLLALHAGPNFSISAAAAIIGVSVREARRMVRALEAVNMLEEVRDRRYAYHDLLRDYGRERAEEEETPTDRDDALRRELSFYLRMVDAADRVLAPKRPHVPIDQTNSDDERFLFTSPSAALAWCDAEILNLVSAVDQAVDLGFEEVAWKLPVALTYFLGFRKHYDYRLKLFEIAVQAARRTRDRWGETWSLICLGGAEQDLGNHEEAIEHFTAALRISRELDYREWEAMSIYNIAFSLRHLGLYPEALDRLRQAIVIERERGDRRAESITLSEFGALALIFKQPAKAREDYLLSLAGARETSDLHTEGIALHGLGDVCRSVDDVEGAIDWYEQAARIRGEVGDLLGLAQSLFESGRLLTIVGRPSAARAALVKALSIFDGLRSPSADDVRGFLQANFEGA